MHTEPPLLIIVRTAPGTFPCTPQPLLVPPRQTAPAEWDLPSVPGRWKIAHTWHCA